MAETVCFPRRRGGERGRWDDVQYGMIHQIMTDMPAYDVRVIGGNGMVIHQSKSFPVALRIGNVAHLGVEADLSGIMFNPPTLAGSTPLGCVGKAPVVTAWGH